jgi:hypothetical protein
VVNDRLGGGPLCVQRVQISRIDISECRSPRAERGSATRARRWRNPPTVSISPSWSTMAVAGEDGHAGTVPPMIS